MKKIIVVDDDHTQLALVKKILNSSGYDVQCFNDPRDMLNEYKVGEAEMILSDVNMPGMSGMDLVKTLRRLDKETPIVMFTTTADVNSVIELFKLGVWDYLMKPVIPADLIHKVGSIIEKNKTRMELKRIEEENSIIDLENKKLINWRKMYGLKDIKQTEQMISFFTRSIDSGGGYVWLDILSDIPQNADGSITLDSKLRSLILDSAGEQRKSYDFLKFIGQLPKMEISKECFSVDSFIKNTTVYLNTELVPLLKENNRFVSLNIVDTLLQGSIDVDEKIIRNIFHELAVNAIKFSPEYSRVFLNLCLSDSGTIITGKANVETQDCLVFTIRNQPKELQVKNEKGKRLKGIPYDSSEIVFDLFSTMEPFPTTHCEEKWTNGTGLFISRTFAKMMGCWIENKNIIDHIGGKPESYVQFIFVIPVI